MNYILYHNDFSDDSPEWIVDAMTQPCILVKKLGENNWVEYDRETEKWTPVKSVQKIIHGGHKIINWGNRIFRDDSIFALNVPSAITRASHKGNARRFLRDAGVAVPNTYFFQEDWPAKPLIARPPKHERGHDFYVLKNAKDLHELASKQDLSDWYFSEIFEKTHEFRVHVAHGKVLLVNIKPFKKGEPLSGSSVNVGEWKALKWSDIHPGICQEAIKATKALGLDYAAVDVMANFDQNEWVICEVNTAPDVQVPYSSSKYADYFSWVIRHNFPPHFKTESGANIFYTNLLAE